MNQKRIAAVAVLAAASAVTSVIAVKTGVDPPPANIAGAFASILVLVIAAKLLKATDDLFYCGLIFVYLASPMGSILDLYRRFGPYDKIIHFISGVLLASVGMMVISRLLSQAVESVKNRNLILLSRSIFAFLFSSAGAGIWEIFEFLADKLAGGGMQRGMVDTVTDIIAGNIGALVYCGIFALFLYFAEKRKNP